VVERLKIEKGDGVGKEHPNGSKVPIWEKSSTQVGHEYPPEKRLAKGNFQLLGTGTVPSFYKIKCFCHFQGEAACTPTQQPPQPS